jgi:predicted negative regulator of RcsB-dependent stress response
MDLPLLLAQDVVLETADKGLEILERVQAGGVILICLIVTVVCAVAFWFQLKRNIKQSDDALTREQQRGVAKDAATKTRLTEQEGFLREMLERDRESQEAQMAAVQAVQGFTHALNEEKAETQGLKRVVEGVDTRLKDLEDLLRRRFLDA